MEHLTAHHRRLRPARRRLRPAPPASRQDHDDRGHRLTAPPSARPVGGTGPLGRTLWRRRTDILAFFDFQASNGPTESINGRLEALRRNALGFRNFTHYRWRSLLHSGALHQLVNTL
jgi:hypothetical protein